MNEIKTVFEKTLETYLEQFKALALDRLANNPAMRVEGRRVSLPFFNETLHVSDDGMVTEHGKKAPFEVCVVVYNYLLRYREMEKRTWPWMAYRDTRNSGPLTVYFADSVEKKIIAVFGNKEKHLVEACEAFGGRAVKDAPGYDLAMVFDALPSCPLLLLFNHEDEGFPATCRVLFQASVERYLDPESLAILGAVFASRLTGPNPA